VRVRVWRDCTDDVSRVRNVFQSMLKLFPGSTTLAAAYLRFEGGQTNLTDAREAAKSLVSPSPTHLPLWNEYAQLEHKSGHLPEVCPPSPRTAPR
jgi:hypothetical protein